MFRATAIHFYHLDLLHNRMILYITTITYDKDTL